MKKFNSLQDLASLKTVDLTKEVFRTIKTEIDGVDGIFDFVVYDENKPIEINDYYIFKCFGLYNVVKCETEQEKFEINKNDLVKNHNKIDGVYNFWKNCYKIKSTNLDLDKVDW